MDVKKGTLTLFALIAASGIYGQDINLANDWGESKAAKTSDIMVPVAADAEIMAAGKYEPTWESLKKHDTPEWFRNAKFGIWAHWGPQCVEGSGDWMARKMYQEGSRWYNYHCKHYGHPSEFGFKDILPLFKAEHWNPDYLVAFYKKLGAQYFFALGNHHDNFDLWDSKYQEWNSMQIGPHKDLLEGWAKAAKKYGMPFGISFHADHAWNWYETAQRYDRSGKYMGVPYDGVLTKEDSYKLNADGTEKWWKGLDPQKLYWQNHPMGKGSWADAMIHRQWGWENGVSMPSQEFVTNFYNRTLDAINRYQPDLIYFDVTVAPFYPISDAGLRIASHFYNANAQWHNGENHAVMFGKILDEEQRKALTWDVERGAPNEIIPEPWQTCSCIGDWHYNNGTYEKGAYKSAAFVAKLLVDIVSKNGNLLLSVPLRADGTFDEKEEKVLNEFGEWMAINKESIIGTRPWTIFGEGPVAESKIELRGQGFNEGSYKNMDANEIRFTQKGKYIDATAMTWPENGSIVIKALGSDTKYHKGNVKSVELLGYGRVKFTSNKGSLVVQLPAKALNRIAPVLKIKK